MKFAAFVALRSTLSILHLSGTELSKVFGSFWGSIGEEFHLNATKGLSLKHVVRRSSFSNVFTLVRYVGQLNLRSETPTSMSFRNSDAILEIADATIATFVTMYMHKINLFGRFETLSLLV